jgi:hypothetical protein
LWGLEERVKKADMTETVVKPVSWDLNINIL